MKTILIKLSTVFLIIMAFTACQRNGELADDFPQEDVSNALLLVKDMADGSSAVYNFQINGSNLPNIKLKNGHEYQVQISLKNGAEDVTEEIKDAKDEHFFIFDFPNSDIVLTREDDAASTRADGNKIGLLTKWKVNTAVKSGNAQVIITLFHESVSVSEQAQTSGNGSVFGTSTGGETDLKVNYLISNF